MAMLHCPKIKQLTLSSLSTSLLYINGPDLSQTADCLSSLPDLALYILFCSLIMTTLRRFRCEDLFKFNNVNLDKLTETYNLNFYLQYLARWPDMCLVAQGPDKGIMAYIIGKAEGREENWHGHVTAVTVASEYRR